MKNLLKKILVGVANFFRRGFVKKLLVIFVALFLIGATSAYLIYSSVKKTLPEMKAMLELFYCDCYYKSGDDSTKKTKEV